MDRKLIITAVSFAIFALVVIGIYSVYQNGKGIGSILPTPTPGQFEDLKSPSATPSSRQGPTPSTQPAAGEGDVVIRRTGISITNPLDGDSLMTPVQVQGYANSQSGKITIKIIDENGDVLGTNQSDVCRENEACQFATLVMYSHPTTTTGSIVAQTFDASGNLEDERQVPVNFLK